MLRGESQERGIDVQGFIARGKVFGDMFLLKPAQIQVGPFQIRRKLDGHAGTCFRRSEVAVRGLEDALKIVEPGAARGFS
jgi:hypothetical protein